MMYPGTCFSVQYIVQGSVGHELADEHEVGRLVTGPQHGEYVRVVEDTQARTLLLEVT